MCSIEITLTFDSYKRRCEVRYIEGDAASEENNLERKNNKKKENEHSYRKEYRKMESERKQREARK